MYKNKGFLPEVERARKIALLRGNSRGRLKVFFHNLSQKICLLDVDEMNEKQIEGYLTFFFLHEADR
jgi:hypothetical protein